MTIATAGLVEAFAYYRMSSDQQCGSIEAQRSEVESWATVNGYRIVGEYVDEGRSAFEDPSKRDGFQRMLRAVAVPGCTVKAILCWDVSRFGRSHPMKMAGIKDRLNSLGIHLATKKQGRLDWETFQGLIVDLLHASQANEYSKSLSADSVRGRIQSLERGEYPNGSVPFGYGRLYTDPATGMTYPVARDVNFKKPRGWKLTLTVNELEAEVVRWVFRQFIDRDLSMRQLAREVADRDSSLKWSKDTIKALLNNKAYAGYAHIGGSNSRLRKKEVANRVGARERAGVVPALITLADWERAQHLVANRKEQGWKVREGTSSPIGGCLVCGRCGYRLEKKERMDATGERYRYFSCPSAIKRPQLGCKQWRVRESDILPVAIEWLVKVVDREVLDQQDVFRLADDAALNADDAPRPSTPVEALRERLHKLQARLAKGRERFLMASDDLVEGLKRTLHEWEEECSEVERELRHASLTSETVTQFTEWWEGVRGSLVEVVPSTSTPDSEAPNIKVFKKGVTVEADRLRRLLKDLGFKLEIYWRPRPNSVRYWELDRARISASIEHSMDVQSMMQPHTVLAMHGVIRFAPAMV